MAKKAIGPRTLLTPLPAVMVGANIDGKPNFSTYAWCGICNSVPPMLTVAIRHQRYTLKGVKQNGTFSVNVPSVDLVKETDYCGTTTGSTTDKVADCGFQVFYGKLENAPMIDQCPVNLECRVMHMLNLGSHNLVVGQIEEVYIAENCLTDEKPDIAKIKPLIFAPEGQGYWGIGKFVAKDRSIGKQIKS
jgi:flavin reductase (DIM6/NTAB) family NADH-FMN oxidoreductase RutF